MKRSSLSLFSMLAGVWIILMASSMGTITNTDSFSRYLTAKSFAEGHFGQLRGDAAKTGQVITNKKGLAYTYFSWGQPFLLLPAIIVGQLIHLNALQLEALTAMAIYPFLAILMWIFAVFYLKDDLSQKEIFISLLALQFGTLIWHYTHLGAEEISTMIFMTMAMGGALRIYRGHSNGLLHMAIGSGVVVFIKVIAAPFLLAFDFYFLIIWIKRCGFNKKIFIQSLVSGSFFVLMMMLMNYHRFGSPFESGYQQVFSNHFPGMDIFSLAYLKKSLPAYLFSDYKGIFFFNPLLIFVTFLAILFRKNIFKTQTLFLPFLISFMIQMVFLGCYIFWQGGVCIGPRFLMPYLIFLAPVIGLCFRQVSSKIITAILLINIFFQFILITRPYKLEEILNSESQNQIIHSPIKVRFSSFTDITKNTFLGQHNIATFTPHSMKEVPTYSIWNFWPFRLVYQMKKINLLVASMLFFSLLLIGSAFILFGLATSTKKVPPT